MTQLLKDRIAIVTGAGGGLGRCHALELARHGARVVVNDLAGRDDGAGARAVVAEIRQRGGQAIAVLGDVTRMDDMDALALQAMSEWGRIDILVNNAGIVFNGNAESYPEEHWDRTFDVNVKGAFLCAQAVFKTMAAQRAGSIVNIGSMSGDIVNWPSRQAAYNASKAALHMLTKCLAVEWAEHRIRVNAIAPGFHLTEMAAQVIKTDPSLAEKHWLPGIIQNRIADPSELAGAAIYLASDASSYTTGHVLTSDGGYTLR